MAMKVRWYCLLRVVTVSFIGFEVIYSQGSHLSPNWHLTNSAQWYGRRWRSHFLPVCDFRYSRRLLRSERSQLYARVRPLKKYVFYREAECAVMRIFSLSARSLMSGCLVRLLDSHEEEFVDVWLCRPLYSLSADVCIWLIFYHGLHLSKLVTTNRHIRNRSCRYRSAAV